MVCSELNSKQSLSLYTLISLVSVSWMLSTEKKKKKTELLLQPGLRALIQGINTGI